MGWYFWDGHILLINMDKKQIIKWYTSGTSIREIARRVGVSNHKVKRHLEKWNISPSDINSNSKYTRECPSCNVLVVHKNKRSYGHAVKTNSVCYSCKNNGKNNPFYNKKHTDEFKEHMSQQQSNISFNGHPVPDEVTRVCKNPDCDVTFLVKETSKKQYHDINCFNRFSHSGNHFSRSGPELKFEEILDTMGINYIPQYELDGKFFDFYITEYDLLIEIDGIYWHGRGLSDEELNEVQKLNRNNDKIKDYLAKKHNKKLIRLWEDNLDVPEYIFTG